MPVCCSRYHVGEEDHQQDGLDKRPWRGHTAEVYGCCGRQNGKSGYTKRSSNRVEPYLNLCEKRSRLLSNISSHAPRGVPSVLSSATHRERSNEDCFIRRRFGKPAHLCTAGSSCVTWIPPCRSQR